MWSSWQTLQCNVACKSTIQTFPILAYQEPGNGIIETSPYELSVEMLHKRKYKRYGVNVKENALQLFFLCSHCRTTVTFTYMFHWDFMDVSVTTITNYDGLLQLIPPEGIDVKLGSNIHYWEPFLLKSIKVTSHYVLHEFCIECYFMGKKDRININDILDNRDTTLVMS